MFLRISQNVSLGSSEVRTFIRSPFVKTNKKRENYQTMKIRQVGHSPSFIIAPMSKITPFSVDISKTQDVILAVGRFELTAYLWAPLGASSPGGSPRPTAQWLRAPTI